MTLTIYTDEAGTSPDQPIAVVASLIVKNGQQKDDLERALFELIEEMVPPRFRENFVLHTTDIFNGKNGYRNSWDRYAFLKRAIALLRLHHIPIAYAAINKAEFGKKNDFQVQMNTGKKLDNNKFIHLSAFSSCMAKTDSFIRKYLNGADKAEVVAEQVSELQNVLEVAGLATRDIEGGFLIPGASLGRGVYDRALGRYPADAEIKIEHIVGKPRFVPKGREAILQLSDACAFFLRRFLSGLKGTEDFIAEMIEPEGLWSFLETPNDMVTKVSGLLNTLEYFSAEQLADARRNTQIITRALWDRSDISGY